MSQHNAGMLQYLLPVLILLPILYIRMRRMSRATPLKLNRLWRRPAIFLALAALVLFMPQPQTHAAPFSPSDWGWVALAALLGAVAGWYWGRTMVIDLHPQDGTLMVKGGAAALMVMVVLIVLRMVLRAGAAMEASTLHLNLLMISDASIVFAALMFSARAAEMFLRGRRMMAAQITG